MKLKKTKIRYQHTTKVLKWLERGILGLRRVFQVFDQNPKKTPKKPYHFQVCFNLKMCAD